MVRILIATGALSVLALPALAEPIYLDCTMDNGGGQQVPWTISADEATGKFNYTHSMGTFEEKAIFTPTEIVVPDGGRVRLMTTIKRISRIDGKFTIEMKIGDNKPTVRLGICKKAEAPKRAF